MRITSGVGRVDETGQSPAITANRVSNTDHEPLPGRIWLEQAVKRLKSAPNCPKSKAAAGRLLSAEMANAYLRRQVACMWTAGHITNLLRDLGLW
jgi:hypothetical protein